MEDTGAGWGFSESGQSEPIEEWAKGPEKSKALRERAAS